MSSLFRMNGLQPRIARVKALAKDEYQKRKMQNLLSETSVNGVRNLSRNLFNHLYLNICIKNLIKIQTMK